MAVHLGQNVLVLNRHWMVIHVTTLKRALCLLFQDLARVVDDECNTYDFASWRELGEMAAMGEGDPRISTPSFSLLVPEVIQLVHYQRLPPRRVKFSRRNIFLRDGHQCQYCGCRPSTADLTIDHVLPKAQGGRSTWDNVVLACMKCNTRKGNRTPEQAGMILSTVPKRPNWLACTLLGNNGAIKPIWTRFIDDAYWNVQLKED